MARTPLNLPACLPLVPEPVKNKDGSFSVLMAGHLELFFHSESDFPLYFVEFVYQSNFMLRLVSQLPAYSSWSLKRPGNFLVPLNLVGRISKVLQVELQTSLLLHLWACRWYCPFPSSSSCLLFKYARVFLQTSHPLSSPTALYMLCSLPVSTHWWFVLE